jgi:hypothetical protein
MNSKKTWPSLALILGIVTSAIGVVLIIAYVIEAYISRKGEPDQSLLFWYLPILFAGIIALVIGLSTSIWGFIRIKKISQSNPVKYIQGPVSKAK